MRISDWSSDVCSSDLLADSGLKGPTAEVRPAESRPVRLDCRVILFKRLLLSAISGLVAGKPAVDVGTSFSRFARRHLKRDIDLYRVHDERVVMLGAKKEKLEIVSGGPKDTRERTPTGGG